MEKGLAVVKDNGDHVVCVFPPSPAPGEMERAIHQLLVLEVRRRGDGGSDPLRVLLDFRALRDLEPGITTSVRRRRDDLKRWVIAVLGPPGRPGSVTAALRTALGHEALRYFTDPQEAEAWLTEQAP